ncbi:MAG: bifunctional phosphoribosylaminoimidazolecarboxamide formyltransferase/IMP cyclohydrolase [Treponema sp.]|nr:bifunctional phosphoribosylaminoimidazolecarboxamide formyltransferase/IMP cyclohydrolase [Treponema sp.]
MKKRALISVYDKSGIKELAQFLSGLGWELVSTGGTFRYLQEQNIPVTDVVSVTGFPECLDGRVKTLHPAIHAGILARRRDPSHMETLEKFTLGIIDLVCVNLYPLFEKVQASKPLSLEETIEFIDIGGPAMIRSAAKNYQDVIVLADPSDYGETMEFLKSGTVPEAFKKRLAGKVFCLTSAYDAAAARYLLDEDYPLYWPLSLKKSRQLRYGENSHQSAALYHAADRIGAMGGMEQLNGKELGYNNIRDIDLAWKTACAFGFPPGSHFPRDKDDLIRLEEQKKIHNELKYPPVCVAVKHNTPCGIAQGATLLEAYEKTYACDPVSIFGGIVACTVTVDAATALKLGELFLEIVAAPDFEEEALAILKKKKNLRIMKANYAPRDQIECIAVDGGFLVQQADDKLLEKWDVVTRNVPEDLDMADMIFGLRAVSYVKSNAIVVVKDLSALGIGGGQTSRIWAMEQALARSSAAVKAAAENPVLTGKAIADGRPARVLASDAFFPFADAVETAAASGIKAIVQPGGSIRDKESIEACDKHGIAMVFTGTRHFKH